MSQELEVWLAYQRHLAAGLDAEARPEPPPATCPECGAEVGRFWGVRGGEAAALLDSHRPTYADRLCSGSYQPSPVDL